AHTTDKDQPMDETSIEIDAPAVEVYDLVADVTNMGRWSPETHKTAWVGDATAAVPGARFKGWNHAQLGPVPIRWSTTCVVRQSDRGRCFSFDTLQSGARWTYRFEPSADDTACTVIESREELRRTLLARVAWASGW